MPDGVRHQRIDTLRGVAVFGILLVNVWSFVYGYGPLRYGVTGPDASVADLAAIFFVASFAEQKFYPIFAFLFGAGFALRSGGQRARGMPLAQIKLAYGRRLRVLLAAGVLHGTLVWFGDILTAYAIGGYYLRRQVGQRLAHVLRSMRRLVWWNLIVLVFLLALFGLTDETADFGPVAMLADLAKAHATYTQGSWSAAALARLTDYGANLAGLIIFMPRIVLLFMAGVVAVRLGWLTRPQRHRALWRRALWLGLGMGVPLNLCWGVIAVTHAVDPLAAPSVYLASTLLDVAGPLLALGYLSAIMLASAAWISRLGNWLAPVGRMALSNYLMQSLLLMTLLQGFALGWGASLTRAGLLGLCAAIMLLQLLTSRWWLARRAQGPAEALWRHAALSGSASGKIAG